MTAGLEFPPGVSRRRAAAHDTMELWRDTRRQVLHMMTSGAKSSRGQPSAYWEEELRELDYLWEATPLVAGYLRRHCHLVTGVRPYDYRSGQSAKEHAHRRRLHQLVRKDKENLYVREPRALGGFGFEIDGGLVNADTLKYYESLIALQRVGVLSDLRTISEPLVVEIGGGWGGFAYQLKAVLPGARVLVVDLPCLFLLSAVYLRAMYPSARFKFLSAPAQLDECLSADFVFCPPEVFLTMKGGVSPALAVNMVSFQEMSSSQVSEYASALADLDCPLLYSLNRERSPYNSELDSVSECVAPHYIGRRIPVLQTDYTALAAKRLSGRLRLTGGAWLRRLTGRGANAYTHRLYRRR